MGVCGIADLVSLLHLLCWRGAREDEAEMLVSAVLATQRDGGVSTMPCSLYRRSVALVYRRGAELLLVPFSPKSPRRRMDGGGGSTTTSFNKRSGGHPIADLELMLPLPLAGHGSEGDRKSVV